MCGRYHQHKPREALDLMFEIGQVLDDLLELTPRYNIAPTQRAPVIRAEADGTRTLALLRWGLIPRWTKGETAAVLRDGARLINARAETAPTKPSFRDAIAKRRCLVPATGYYEWRTGSGAGSKAVKQPFNMTPAEGVFFAMAGIWERWQAPEGADAGPVETFSILTCAANGDVRDIHDRMPVLIPRDAFDLWLNPGNADLSALTHLVEPACSGTVVYAPANPLVGAVRNDGPWLLSAAAEAPEAPEAPLRLL